MTVPFGRTLTAGSSPGRDVQGVKRALGRAAGTNDPGLGTQTYGAAAVMAVRKFQREAGLFPDGIYGPLTHARLSSSFDLYAYWLYTGHAPPSVETLQLPDRYHPTHDTSGLNGYPAIDMFASPGTRVLAPEDGELDRSHFLAWSLAKRVGGWTTYLAAPSAVYFLTHLGEVLPSGSRVRRGQDIGSVGVVPHDWWPSHIHEGKHEL
jgi:murein DD-endopeptidase MepM/ murein hydrolase activator NlpD